MDRFSFRLLQDARFGPYEVESLPELLHQADARHVFLVSDRRLEAAGLVDMVRSIIVRAGYDCTCFLDVEPDPTAKIIEACAAHYRDCGADVTVALGGGSSIDAAKAMRAVARYGGHALDYEGTGKIPGPLDPLIAIPTTAGTGSEFTNGAVISDHERVYKTVLADPHLAARFVILDPTLLAGLPAAVAASCGADAWIHAMEAYVSRSASPWSDALAEKALALIGANLRPFVACRADQEAAGAMLLGSAFAGAALALGRLGLIHAMSHPVSAFFGVPHGVANAVLTPAVLAYNACADCGRYAKFYSFLTGDRPSPDLSAEMLIEAWRRLMRDLGVPGCLADLSVTEDKLAPMVADTMKSPYVATNPRTFGPQEVLQVFQRSMHIS